MDLAPFARMDDPVALPSPSPEKGRRRRFNDDDDDDDDDPMSTSAIQVLNQAQSSADYNTAAASAFLEEEEKQTDSVTQGFNENRADEADEERPNDDNNTYTTVLLDDDPRVGFPGIAPPFPPSLVESSSPAISPLKESSSAANQQQKRPFEGTDQGGLNDSRSGLTPKADTSAIAQRNKATEPDVFWSDLSDWLKTVEPITDVSVDDPVQGPRTLTNPTPPITFLVKTSISLDGVRRRYSDFELIRQYLTARFPGILILALPEKKAIGNTKDDFLQDRAKGLRMFLESVVSNEYLRADGLTRAFLVCQPQEWESVKKLISTAIQQLQQQQTIATPPLPQSQLTDDGFTRSVQSPSGVATSQPSDERWKSAIHMTQLPPNFDDEITKAHETLLRLESMLRTLVQSATKCAQASKAYAKSISDLHQQFTNNAKSIPSLASLENAMEFWSESNSVESILIEDLLVDSLQKELDLVSEMRRMLDARKDLVAQADYKLTVLHKYEDERQTHEKTGQLDKAVRSAQKVQDAVKQVKQADYRLEVCTKALFLSGIQAFVPARIKAIFNVMGRLAFGELRFGDLMKSVWMGMVASLRLNLAEVERDSGAAMESLRRQVPEKFRGIFSTNNLPSTSN